MFKRKTFWVLLFIGLLSIPIAIIPEIIGGNVALLCEQYLGGNYKYYLAGIFILGSWFLTFTTMSLRNGLLYKKHKQDSSPLAINLTEENRQYLANAKHELSKGNSRNTLHELNQIEHTQLQENVFLLSTRSSKLEGDEIAGVLSFDQRTLATNRINKDILGLITRIEMGQEENEVYIKKVKAYLKEKYQNRLNQKLANRQPVNLRISPSAKGTTPVTSASFVTYNSNEIKEELSKVFKRANSRMLLIGSPGSGKTTLLLQLELKLLESEKNTLPVVLNLTTWQNRFITLENWLQEILPSEMGINKALAKKIIAEYPLILLLDGFDEVKKADRRKCLEAIGRFGAVSQNQFTISSRVQEYKEISKDAPVNTQIEISPLKHKQIEQELAKMGHSQPGSQALLQAFKNDKILKDTAQSLFYFNTLQLLFANGERLDDFQFTATNQKQRKIEILLLITDCIDS